MASKKRKLYDVSTDDEIGNPVKKRKMMGSKFNEKEVTTAECPSNTVNMKCFDCRKISEWKQCEDCKFEHCVECGVIKVGSFRVTTIENKLPCSKCIAREYRGKYIV